MKTKRIISWTAALAVFVTAVFFSSAFITAQAGSLFTIQGTGGSSSESGTVAELNLAAGNTAYCAVDLNERIFFKFRVDSIASGWVAFGFGKNVISDLDTSGLFALNFPDGRVNVRGVTDNQWVSGGFDFYNANPNGPGAAWGTGWHTFALESKNGLWTMTIDGVPVMNNVNEARLDTMLDSNGFLSVYTSDGGTLAIDLAEEPLFTLEGAGGSSSRTGTATTLNLAAGNTAYRAVDFGKKISFKFRVDSITAGGWLAFGFGKTVISDLDTTGLFALNFPTGAVNVRASTILSTTLSNNGFNFMFFLPFSLFILTQRPIMARAN